MIFIKNIQLQFGSQIVFDNISCSMNARDRIGLVGRNGTGKSTLLKAIADQTQLDHGDIEIQRGATIAYMPQEVVIASQKNVIDETLSSFSDLYAYAQERDQLQAHIDHNPTAEQLNRYAELEYELLEQGYDEKRAETQRILAGLGFDQHKQQLSVDQLSVGWRMRIVLAKLLLQKADFYLFDEPTNHLDITAKTWFLNFLQTGNFGYLLVCHDRYFLDKACNKTYELSMGKLIVYHGNYSYYQEQKKIRSEYLEQAHAQQQREIKHKVRTVERFKASATKASMAQSILKKLDKIERIELDQPPKTMEIKLQAPQRSGQYVLTVKNVSHSFDHNTLFGNVSFEIERGDKVGLIAPNGTGKTTLFNLIAKKLDLQHGSISLGHNVTTALFDQDQEKILDPEKTILEEVIASCPRVPESQIRSILGALLFSGDDVYKKTAVLSGGERNRVAMAKVIISHANFFLLDEPTNHLDIESKEVILETLKRFEGTILFVSHDQDFVNKLATKIIELTPSGVTLFYGNYDSYLITKQATQKLKAVSNNQIHQKKTNDLADQHSNQQELQKKAKQLENKITQLERTITDTIEKLSLELYDSAQYHKLIESLSSHEKQLQACTAEWEITQKQLYREQKL